jgi:uncharacterized protein YjbI with pentapeptide repeats
VRVRYFRAERGLIKAGAQALRWAVQASDALTGAPPGPFGMHSGGMPDPRQDGALVGADFSRAALVGARTLLGEQLALTVFVDADLRGAHMRGADLFLADLRGADLRGADLRGAHLDGADLRGADLRGAALASVTWGDADLRGALLDPEAVALDEEDALGDLAEAMLWSWDRGPL